MTSDFIARCLQETCTELQNAGMVLEAIICDAASAHKVFFKGKFVFAGFKVPVFPDFVHFFKRLKTLADNAMKKPIQLDGGGCINFVSLKEAWTQLRNEGGLLSPFPKLTANVMTASRFDSMRVSYALAFLTSPGTF